MPLQKLQLKPGVNRENTRYTNEGGWYESDKVRFRQGTPEKIGGWLQISGNTFTGICRSLWNWITLAGQNLLGVGTASKFYIENGGAYYDVTPIRAQVTLTNPFTTNTTTNSGGQTTVIVTDGLGGFVNGDYVTFYNASVINGVTVSGEYALTFISTSVYSIQVTGTSTSPTIVASCSGAGANTLTVTTVTGGTIAVGMTISYFSGSSYISLGTIGAFTGTGSGGTGTYTVSAGIVVTSRTMSASTAGGGTVYAVYQVTTGSTTYTPAVGWGASSWGTPPTVALPSTVGTWGIGIPSIVSAVGTRIWGQLNWGEDLVYGPRNGPLYYWDATVGYTSTTVTMTNANPCVVTCSLGLLEGTPITFSTTGALSTGGTTTLLPGKIYYVKYLTASTFNIALTSGGAAISTAGGSQSGVQSISPRGVPLSSLTGADSSVPVAQSTFTISDASRFLIVFGTNNYGESVVDPMLVRWSDQESLTTWTPAITNQAGSVRLSHGSKIVTTLQSRQEIAVWTDSSLYSLQYLGPPYVWGTQLLADNISIIGPNAAVMASGISYWMGVDKFYKYDGRTQTLRCDLRQYIYNDINLTQSDQVFGSTNEGFNEVWWFYCSSGSNTIDKYVIYNYLEDNWYYGSMARTAWLDTGLRNFPIAATYSYNIVQHENGVDDGTIIPATAISASITSSQYDIGDGNNFAFVYRMIPDLTFRGSTSGTTPQITMYLQGLNNSGSGVTQSGNADVLNTGAITSTVNVDQFTGQVYIRVRGRQMQMQITSNTLGTQWQLGAPRIDIRPDGRR